METRKRALLAALFYPLSIVTIAAGFIAFIMILLKIRMLVTATVVFWFYWACSLPIYRMSKPLAEMLGVKKVFFGFFAAVSTLAALSTIVLALEQLGIIAVPA